MCIRNISYKNKISLKRLIAFLGKKVKRNPSILFLEENFHHELFIINLVYYNFLKL